MIIIKLQGGLGNQMFQYAAGKQLAFKHKTILKLDISSYEFDELRKFALKNFNIDANIANKDEISKLKINIKLEDRYRKRLLYLINNFKTNHFREKERIFNKKFNKLGDNTYLEGYFQSEKYFSNIEKELTKEFTENFKFSKDQIRIKDLMQKTDSICVHVRRTDYLTNNKINKEYNVCSLSYYNKAIGYLKKELKKPFIFIFSDDLEWVKNNLNTNCKQIYIKKDLDISLGDADTLLLMSKCKNFIIANSSFSWWASKLSQNDNEIKIGPNKWTSVLDHREDLLKDFTKL